jgi:hypothetical protein
MATVLQFTDRHALLTQALEREYHRGYSEGYKYGAAIAWGLAREEAALSGKQLPEQVPDEQGLREDHVPD